MYLLKRENWWCWLLLAIASLGTSNFVLGALLDVYDKDAWYTKKINWILGIVCAILPAVIMLIVFTIQITATIASKLNAPGREIYLSPYVWIVLLILPIVGWTLLIVMLIYIYFWNLVMLARGGGERFVRI